VGHLLWLMINELETENNLLLQDVLWGKERQLDFLLALAQLIPSNLYPGRSSLELPGPLVRKARDLMVYRIKEPFHAAEIARQLGVSLQKLQESFSWEGRTFRTEKKKLRVEAAVTRLRHSEGMTIADIALEFGFKNPGRFAADCEQVYGHLPSKIACT
jgi:transcriptional regulator GlxA family with amidase domain